MSKLVSIWIVGTYRTVYKLFMVNGILFNNESEVSGPELVTRNISTSIAKIYNGIGEPVILGNLDTIKDWGYAKDYMYGMWKMLQLDCPGDFV